MSVITKDITEGCGLIWKVRSWKVSLDTSIVGIRLKGYADQASLNTGKHCNQMMIKVPYQGNVAHEAWCLNAVKIDPNSALKGGVIT